VPVLRYIRPNLATFKSLLNGAVVTPLRWLFMQIRRLITVISNNGETVIALSSLFVSVATVYVAREALKDQHHHNVLSVRPLPMLTVYDGQEKLEVVLHNNGSGPLIIKNTIVSDGSNAKNSVIEWMPDLPEGMRWDAFASETIDRSVPPGGEIPLIRLVGKQSDPVFRAARDKCRDALGGLTVKVNYSDIYGTRMNPHEKELSWFGRHKEREPSGR
jgi:hypothetical protein